jgi:Tfp pilus assembly protein PilN
MGLFWDLYQQSQLSEQRTRAESLEERVAHLEQDNARLAQLLRDVIARLEQHVGVDLDKDGRVG